MHHVMHYEDGATWTLVQHRHSGSTLQLAGAGRHRNTASPPSANPGATASPIMRTRRKCICGQVNDNFENYG